MSSHVLMHSREYGTEAFPCASVERAVVLLSLLARSAEEERKNDGVQRYFCLAAPQDVLPPAEPQSLTTEVVVYIKSGAVGWVACDDPHVRIRILDADWLGDGPPVACWEQVPISLREIEEPLRRLLFLRRDPCLLAVAHLPEAACVSPVLTGTTMPDERPLSTTGATKEEAA